MACAGPLVAAAAFRLLVPVTDSPVTNAIATLEKALGYRFNDPALLTRALSHASAAVQNYQRLEFLGDRVLNLVVADLLYTHFPDEPEGHLSKRHAALVRGEYLAPLARRLNIGALAVISEAEAAMGGAENDNILADMMEAVIGAVFVDGGFAAAQTTVTALIGDSFRSITAPPRDPKTALQEWTQARGQGLPEYKLVERTGPDHSPVFVVEVAVAGHDSVTGTAPSKRTAEKIAAQAMLAKLEGDDAA